LLATGTSSGKSGKGASVGKAGKGKGSKFENLFIPLHWVSYFSDTSMLDFVTVAISLQSGLLKKGNIKDRVQFSISVCGTFLNMKCTWPEMLHNFEYFATGWKNDTKLSTEQASSMLSNAEQHVQRIRQTNGIQTTKPPVSSTKFKLNFEVERDIVKIVVLMDNRNGVVAHVVMRSMNKEKVEIEHDMAIMNVAPKKKYDTDSSSESSTITPVKKYHKKLKSVTRTSSGKSTGKSTGTEKKVQLFLLVLVLVYRYRRLLLVMMKHFLSQTTKNIK
jgi:hypothetical protein